MQTLILTLTLSGLSIRLLTGPDQILGEAVKALCQVLKLCCVVVLFQCFAVLIVIWHNVLCWCQQVASMSTLIFSTHSATLFPSTTSTVEQKRRWLEAQPWSVSLHIIRLYASSPSKVWQTLDHIIICRVKSGQTTIPALSKGIVDSCVNAMHHLGLSRCMLDALSLYLLVKLLLLSFLYLFRSQFAWLTLRCYCSEWHWMAYMVLMCH